MTFWSSLRHFCLRNVKLPKRRGFFLATCIYSANSSSADIDFEEAAKLCKYAISALQYEDVDTAIGNLTKALAMLNAAKR